MSELFKPAVKIKKFNCCLKDNGVMTLTVVDYVTSLVTWPLDSRPFPISGPLWRCVYLAPLSKYGTSKKASAQTWHFGSHDAISHVAVRLAVGHFPWVVHCEHASILHCWSPVKIWTDKI